jgi:cytochrome c-type biogenesis protein CcmF
LLSRTRQLPRASVGMMVAHLGVAVFIFGVTIVKTHEVERDVRMRPGDSATIGNLRFTLKEFREVQGPNYRGVQGLVEVTDTARSERLVASMRPEKRIYRVQQMPMTEAAIRTGLIKDLYVSLGEPVEGGAWIVRLYVKPFVDWIWGGCALMALGGLLAATDRRYRARRPAEQAVPGAAAAA